MVYLEDTSLFQYTESRHRPDKFQFVDFARRNGIKKKSILSIYVQMMKWTFRMSKILYF